MLLFVFGLFLSSIYSYLILPNNEGNMPKINPTLYPFLYDGMVIIPYDKKNAIHLHHWILYFSICMVSIFVYIPNILVGFSLGLFIQGIQYKDSFTFICDNPYNSHLKENKRNMGQMNSEL
tara:strand:+ start:7558 stop:7920 length:363 start_codon:yes stop_codon:yes gene_type:complete